MASTTYIFGDFQHSFDTVYNGITITSSQWKTDLKQLTDETRKIVQKKEKSEEIKNKLLQAISQLRTTELDPKKVKEALLSIFKGIDEMQANMMLAQPLEAIESEMQKKIGVVFAANVLKPQETVPPSKERNLEILMQIATQHKKSNEKDKDLAEKMGKLTCTPSIAFDAVKGIKNEIQFKFASSIHLKAIHNIDVISSTVEKLNQSQIAHLSYQELQQLLNEARGAMQTAQDIIIDLGKYDELHTKELKEKAENLKDRLKTSVDSLSTRMTALFESEKCVTATNELEEKATGEEKTQFNTTIDLYIQKSAGAIALVNVEKNIQEAQTAFTQADNAPADIEKAGKAIQTTSAALNQISKALGPFQETVAAMPAIKKTNPFLTKLQAAQKKLTDQSKAVEENLELKKALESNQEAKKVFQETVQQPAAVAIKEVGDAVAAIENPSQQTEFSEKQQKFFILIQKTVGDESSLDGKLKADISTLAQRAIPLMRIQESGQLCKADSFSICQMMIDYCNILNYIYDTLDNASKIALEDLNNLNTSMAKDGIHALATFMRSEYDPDFKKLLPDIKKLIGEDLLSEYNAKLNTVWEKYDNVMTILNRKNS